MMSFPPMKYPIKIALLKEVVTEDPRALEDLGVLHCPELKEKG